MHAANVSSLGRLLVHYVNYAQPLQLTKLQKQTAGEIPQWVKNKGCSSI